MKIKYYLSLINIIFLLILCGCGKNSSDPVPTEPLIETVKTLDFTLNGNPSDNSVYIEKVSINYPEVTLNIKIKNGLNVYGAAMEVTYDSSKIKYTFSNRGDLLGSKNNTMFYADLNKGQQGTLIIGIYKEGNVAGVNGDGTLVKMVFDIIALDTSTVIEFNAANCSLNSSLAGNPDIPNTSWIGGTLNYR